MNYIPYVIEKTATGERSYDLYSRMLKERIVFLGGEVNDPVSSSVCAQLLFLEAEDPAADINFYINSPGGLVTAGMAIYDTMQYIKPAVSTIVMGQACSMGSLLAQAGAPGKRYVLPHSRTMIHQPSGGARGQATDMMIQVEEILKLKRSLTDIYVKHNSQGKQYEEIARDLERDYFLSASEAVAYGLADQVLADR